MGKRKVGRTDRNEIMAESKVKQLQVLVLGTADSAADLTAWVDAHAHVQHVDTFEAAMAALGEAPFDVVISHPADFLPFRDMRLSLQVAAIIDSVNQGICIVGAQGDPVWSNSKMLGYPAYVRDRVCACCAETFQWAREGAEAGTLQIRGRRFGFTTPSGAQFEMTATPVTDLHGRIIQVAAVVWDATSARNLQDKMDAIDEAGRELVSLDIEQFSRLDTQERLSLLEQKILRCTRDLLHFDNFEVYVIDKSDNRLEIVLSSGESLPLGHADLFVSTEGNGICGYVASRGRSYLCPDVATDARYAHGIEHARSSLTVPLRLHDRVVGVANFESARAGAFGEDDRQFAEILGRYIALALHILELLTKERRTTTGKLGHDMMAEITAPLNDILTDTENLTEDYIGHDDLRHRLRQLSDNAVRIREIIKELTSTKPVIRGVHSTATKTKDPILNGKRILVADDEDIVRDTVCDVLRGYGCIVEAVADGRAAIAMIDAEPMFDLILSDIRMPYQTGYDVFAAAKDNNADTPVILTTGFGYDPNHSIVRARREGLAAVLFKPFKVDQLLGEIRTALSGVQQRS